MNIKKLITLLVVLAVVFTGFLITQAKPDAEQGPWYLKSYEQDMTYGGSITQIGTDSYRFESRTNPYCLTHLTRCNKALVSYKKYQQPVNGKIVVFSFDLTISQYNFDSAPNWWVIFQDWVRIDPENRTGNRPISTLEIKSYGHKLYLRHKDSAYQWGTDKHRSKQVNNGQLEIKLATTYHIEIRLVEGVTAATGGMSLLVDGKKITDVSYQTKSASQWRENVQEFGIYHSKSFDTAKEKANQIIFTLENLTRVVRATNLVNK